MATTYGVHWPGTKKYVLSNPRLMMIGISAKPALGITDYFTINRGDYIYAFPVGAQGGDPNGLAAYFLRSNGHNSKEVFSAGDFTEVKTSLRAAAPRTLSFNATGDAPAPAPASDTGYFAAIGSVIGFAGGAYFAYKRGSSFWGYVGWIILFNMIGWSVGGAADLTMKKIKTT